MRAFKSWMILLVVALAGSCWAQSESLLIGPGDVLAIKVLETNDLDQQVRVSDSGEITLMLGGTIKVAGLTPDASAKSVENALLNGKYILHPHVTVNVAHYATQNVSILGQVKNPGTFPIGTPRSVLDVLALAGGLNDHADREITIERRITKEKVKYFLSNDSNKAMDSTVTVNPGDLVMVPAADVVYVLGNVGRPGGFAKTTNDARLTVLQAVAMAGGALPSASANKARLIRKKPDGSFEDINLQLSSMQKGKTPDMQLQSDDVIYVPFSFTRNLAMGASSLVAAAASATIYHF